MHGNVSEWCRDWYGETTYDLGANDPVRTVKPSEDHRVLRGGSWSSAALYCRAAYRNQGFGHPAGRTIYRGFRVVVVLP
jgi:formylglycine-generating enzyme required for sulfatase activity